MDGQFQFIMCLGFGVAAFTGYSSNISKKETECKTLEPKDSADYVKLKYDFYKGKKNGMLYERKLAVDKTDSNYCDSF